MDKPTEKKEKVIITPRPPRSSFEQWIPVEPVAPEVPDEAPAEGLDTVIAVNPGVSPLNNQVQGPAAGLAGAPAQEAPAEEE